MIERLQPLPCVALWAAIACSACGPSERPSGAGSASAAPAEPASVGSGAAALPTASASAASPSARPPRTPNEFLTRGTPTFIRGTAGDERADRAIRGQIELVRSLFFPTAAAVDDTTIDATKGPAAWPANPVLYGGPHVNALLAKVAPQLPFELRAGQLVLGLDKMESSELSLVTVVPARAPDEHGPGYPAFLLYAGTGTPGVEEINAVTKGNEGIFVGDAFGVFIRGDWVAGPSGKVTARFGASFEREDLEHGVVIPATLAGTKERAAIDIRPMRGDPTADDAPFRAAILRGLETSVRKLGVERPSKMTVFIYPDLKLKEKLTGSRAAGHAVPSSRALHVVKADPKPGGDLERLAAHEGTHLLLHDAWGPAATALFGEGLAVWVAGSYGGVPLEAWKTRLGGPTVIKQLLGREFFRLPEAESYPRAGLAVAAILREVGPDKVREHLLGATALDWDAACERAGTTAAKLQAAVER